MESELPQYGALILGDHLLHSKRTSDHRIKTHGCFGGTWFTYRGLVKSKLYCQENSMGAFLHLTRKTKEISMKDAIFYALRERVLWIRQRTAW